MNIDTTKKYPNRDEVAKALNCKRTCFLRARLKPGATFFDDVDSEQKAYWLGFLYADGCLLQDGRTISIGYMKGMGHIFRFSPISFKFQSAHN